MTKALQQMEDTDTGEGESHVSRGERADRPDVPECRVLTATEPAGAIRFELPLSYAKKIYTQLQRNRALHDRDGHVPLVVWMDDDGYRSLTEGLARIYRCDEVALETVRPVGGSPDVAITIALDDETIKSAVQRNVAALQQRYPDERYGQEFEIDWDTAAMLELQLGAMLEEDSRGDSTSASDTGEFESDTGDVR